MSNNTIGYIADGMEAPGYIAEVPGLHVALRFKYRPTLNRTRARVSEQMRNATPERSEELCAAHVCKQLTEWDLTAPAKDGNPGCSWPDITVDNLLKLQPTLSVKLFGIVMGSTANDVDPDDSESSRSSDTELHRELDDLPPDDGETDHAGNSGQASS